MSNFSFLKIENEYTQNEAYKKMVEYVMDAESYFYIMDTLCGQYTRFAIEQYVEFISALYNIKYATKPTQLAHYLYGDNAKKLISKIGEGTFGVFWTLNDLSKVYCYAGIPRSDKKYNELLPYLYDLMVDLYKRIGGKKADCLEKFSYEKIETKTEVITPNGIKMKIVPAEIIETMIPAKEPVSPKPMYEVKKQRGSVYLIDKEGNVLNRYVDYEKYQGTEGEKKELKKKLKEVEGEYASIVQKMSGKLDERDTEILSLRRKINELLQGEQQDAKVLITLKQKIHDIESEKRKIRVESDEQITKLQEMWLEADNKYQSLYISSAEEQQQLKAEVANVLSMRDRIQNELRQTEEKYNATIKKLKSELEKANLTIDNYQGTSELNSRIIPQLKRKIEQLEKEKKEYIINFEKRNSEIRLEIKNLLESKERQEQKNAEWQNLISQLIFENEYYKEVYIRRTKQEEKEYLSVVQNAISQINEETSLYQQSITEQMLRTYLLRVKKAYEKVIEEERRRADYWKHKYESERIIPEDEQWEESDKVDVKAVKEEDSVLPQKPKSSRGKKKEISVIIIALLSIICLLLLLLIYFEMDKETEGVDTEKVIETEVQVTEVVDTDSETVTETEDIISTGINSQLPDDSVLQDALNRKQPPESWFEVEGVNEALLEEIASIYKDKSILDYYPINAEHYNGKGYYCLGEHGIFNTSYGASGLTWAQRGIFQEDLYMNVNHSYIKFFYYRSGVYGSVGFAVLPEAISSEINAQTSIDELTELFVEEPKFKDELPGITSFSTAEKEIGVVYKIGSDDVLFLFNEDGFMCDYAYISAKPHKLQKE